jgi:hypothetical protein
MRRHDIFTFICIGIICLLALYYISEIPDYPSLYIEEGFDGKPVTSKVPTSIKCTMTSLNAVAGPNTGESGGQTWLCADESNATSLLAGDKSYKPARPYISASDIVCLAQDGSKDSPPTIYSCLDRSQPPGDPSELNQYTAYTNSCDNYLRSYLDISNSLTTLLNMKLAAFDGSQNLVKSLDALRIVYGQYKCA